ncbi:MAG: glycosyltransferase [Gemmatimonadota bacterium]
MHVIAPAAFGGAETVVQALAESSGASGRDASVALISQRIEPPPLLQGLRDAGVPVDLIYHGRRAYAAQAAALESVLRSRQPSVVHTHVYLADFIGWAAARRTGSPLVATLHGHTGGSPGNRLYEWLDRRLLRRFDAVICVSEESRRRLARSGCDPAKLHVVRNGFAPRAFLAREEARRLLGIPQEAMVAGWIGRLSVEKGPDLFVDAMSGLRGGDVTGVAIGDGEQRASLEERAQRSGAPIRFMGAMPNASRLMRAFDVVVLSSRTEGTPMVLLDAMAASVPVVAFPVGGIPDVVNEASAWLALPGDAPALGEAIRNATGSAGEASARARAARATLDRDFGTERWLADIDRVYASVLA